MILPAAASAGALSDAEALAIVHKHCVMCHAAKPTHPAFAEAPNDVTLETLADLKKYARSDLRADRAEQGDAARQSDRHDRRRARRARPLAEGAAMSDAIKPWGRGATFALARLRVARRAIGGAAGADLVVRPEPRAFAEFQRRRRRHHADHRGIDAGRGGAARAVCRPHRRERRRLSRADLAETRRSGVRRRRHGGDDRRRRCAELAARAQSGHAVPAATSTPRRARAAGCSGCGSPSWC